MTNRGIGSSLQARSFCGGAYIHSDTVW